MLQKFITSEHIDSSSTVTVSPVAHTPLSKGEYAHSDIQDIYFPIKPNNSGSLSVTTDKSDHDIKESASLRQSFSQTLKASLVASVPLQVPVSTMSAKVSALQKGFQGIDTSETPTEGLILDGKYRNTELKQSKVRQQSCCKQRKKKGKTSSLDFNGEKAELKRPMSDDSCNCLQLEASDKSRKLDKKEHITLSRLCDQSHDFQSVAGDSVSQDAEQSAHFRSDVTSSSQKSLQYLVLGHSSQTHSSIVQQPELSESEAVSIVGQH